MVQCVEKRLANHYKIPLIGFGNCKKLHKGGYKYANMKHQKSWGKCIHYLQFLWLLSLHVICDYILSRFNWEFPKSTNSKTQSEMKYLKKSIYMHMFKIVLFGSKFKKPLVFHCKANYLVWCLIKKVVRTLGEIHFHEKSSNVFCEAEIKSLLPKKSFLDIL